MPVRMQRSGWIQEMEAAKLTAAGGLTACQEAGGGGARGDGWEPDSDCWVDVS